MKTDLNLPANLPPPETLKPCPFCGMSQLHRTSNGSEEYFVECSDCGASGPVDIEDFAIQEWNKRAFPLDQPALQQPQEASGEVEAVIDRIVFTMFEKCDFETLDKKEVEALLREELSKLHLTPGWQDIASAPRDQEEVNLFSAKWIDPDFNPTGTARGFCNGQGEWEAAFYNSYNCDCYQSRLVCPTHFQVLLKPLTL